MSAMRLRMAAAILAGGLGACAHGSRPATRGLVPREGWRDPSPHTSRLVEANGVRLHLLDWGGQGETVVLLAGLGNTEAPRYLFLSHPDDVLRRVREFLAES